MKRIRLGILLTILVVFLLSATLVYADTPDPDDTPAVVDINIYQNSIEVGDMLIIVYANIPYATIPPTPVTQTFIWRLIDTDNVTELGSTTGNNYNDDGYGYNVYSMYFDAANVTALGIVWGTSYTMRLSGNPVVFDTPPIYNYVINAGHYSVETTRTSVQAEIADRIILLATDLDIRWGLTPVYSLLTQTETATVLSLYGEAFFRGAIHGVQAMAPAAFSVAVRPIDIDPRVWDPEYSVNITGQYTGTWVDTAQAAGDALFGTNYNFLSMLILLVMCGGLMWGNVSLTGDHWNGLLDCTVLGIIGARLGWYDLAFLMLIGALCWMYISAKVWYGIIK